jgi:D-beta-D-heptose 7-phosphate kinase/D-beta-D-heptose 1-phosphate adenosyltransferase
LPDNNVHYEILKALAIDFAICKDENGELSPQLIELQGFPSLYYFQTILAGIYKSLLKGSENLKFFADGIDEEKYYHTLDRIILNGHDPKHVIIMEVEPEKQNTYIDLLCTSQRLGIEILCISNINTAQLQKIIYSKTHLQNYLELNKLNNIGLTSGCFDILHEGHLMLLNTASVLGGSLVVGINSDNSVNTMKGLDRPYISELNRARTLSQFPSVDLVIIFSGKHPLEILKKVRPDIVVKGLSYELIDYPEKSFLESLDCEIVYTSHIEGLSTTDIVKNIKDKL